MRLNLSKVCLLTTLGVCLVLIGIPVNAQPNNPLQVLILNSFDESTAPYFQPRNVFMVDLQKRHPTPIAFRQFDLKQRSGGTEQQDDLKARLLLNEVAEISPDLVFAIGPPAVAFWLKHRGPVLLNTPFIALASELALVSMNFLPGDAVVATRFSFLDTVKDIRAVKPETSHIVMVFGPSTHEQNIAALAKRQLEGLSGQIRFEYTSDMPLVALLKRLAELPADSAVLFGIFDSDASGVVFNDYSGLVQVRAASSAPVFGAFDDQVGRGIVGGRLIQLEHLGHVAAFTAERVLQEQPKEVSWELIDVSQPIYDWRELQAWGIDVDRLPAGSEIRFQPPTLWEHYTGWLLLAGFVFATQALLIASLLIQHRRRRRAEKSSSSLGSKLITAHEDERRHLARELHDDLSQRLARLAIDASYVSSNLGSDAANDVMKNIHPELVSISKDVHDMSYRLHPSLVEDLGIVAALRTECQRIRRQSDAEILEKYDEISQGIPTDTALNIYRIAQEALHNAVKCSRADTIGIVIECKQQLVSLEVNDDGIGFDVRSELAGGGLGLSSMRERALLIGGVLNINSQPGAGTSVSVSVPLQGNAE